MVSSKEFVGEIQGMVRTKHSKDHLIIGMIEEGELDRDGLKGFIGQFYLFFPKPFPKPIAAMLSRCPDDPELEKMWIENVVEEGTGESPGPTATRGCSSDLPGPAASQGKNWIALTATGNASLSDWRELLMFQRSWLELYACQGFCLEGTAGERMTRSSTD